MQTFTYDRQPCPNPDIVAARLIAMRNIYLRQELRAISDQIQKHYEEHLPALQLVALAAYEQVFHRRPLAPPAEIRQDAVKYGVKYYERNLDKLRVAEAENGLGPSHDRLSCSDEKCPLHPPIQPSRIDTATEPKKSPRRNRRSKTRRKEKKKRH